MDLTVFGEGRTAEEIDGTLGFVFVHILKVLCSETGLFPVIIESFGGMDSKGNYTTKVVFQAVA